MVDKREFNITFMIGNGFDIALANKVKPSYLTTYRNIYEWNRKYEFSNIEQKDNNLVNSIYQNYSSNLWSDFEDGLISYFSKINDEKGLIDFFLDKDQFCGYMYEYLKNFYERDLNIQENYEIVAEFQNSVVNFINRMDDTTANTVSNYVGNYLKEINKVVINFINFNGTNTIEVLVNELRKCDLYICCNDKKYEISELKEIKYVHSKLDGKTANYHEFAFGTTAYSFSQNDIFNTLNPQKIPPKSVKNLLNKTNYDFEQWIAKTDLFITHGLSFGKSDEFYWNKIWDKLNKGAMLVDFPYITKQQKESRDLLKELKKSRIKSFLGTDLESELDISNKIVISGNFDFKPGENSSSIFSF